MDLVRCTRLIARERELAFLTERFRQAAAGHGSIVVIEGEPGIGKTRLVSDFLEAPAVRDARRAVAYCFEHARSPLGPIAELTSVLHGNDPKVLNAIPAARRVLARVVPDIEAPTAATVVSEGPRAQYEALSTAFGRFAESRTTVLVAEDVHWSDRSSVEFLRYYAERVRTTRSLLLVTRRSMPEESTDPFTLVRPTFVRRPGVYLVELSALSRSAIAKLLRDAAHGRASLDDEQMRTLQELSGGNPLFAEELLGNVLREGRADPIPSSLRNLLLAKMDQLEPIDRETLTFAAVLGRRFNATFLADLTNRPIDLIFRALRRAREAHLIVEDVREDGAATFRHPLIREMLYGSLLAAEARRLHHRIAIMLEAMPTTSTRVSNLAYHWWAARDWPRAATCNELAGDQAMAMLTPSDAVSYFERAALCSTERGEKRAVLQRKLGDALSQSGLPVRAQAAYKSAIELFREFDDKRMVAEISLLIGRESAASGVNASAVSWRSAGLEAAESLPDDPVWFTAHASSALSLILRGNFADANALLARAEPFAGERTVDAQVDFFDARATSLVLAGNWDGANSEYAKAVAVAQRNGRGTLLVRAHCNWASAAIAAGEVGTAITASKTALSFSTDALVPLYRAYASAIAGRALLVAGERDQALKMLTEARRFVEDMESARPRSQVCVLGLALGVQLSRDDLIEEYLDREALEAAFSSTEVWWIGSMTEAFVEAEAKANRFDEVRRLLERAIAMIPAIGLSPGLACLAGRFADESTARRARGLLEPWALHDANRVGRAYLDLFDGHMAARAGAHADDFFGRAERRFRTLRMTTRAQDAAEALEGAKSSSRPVAADRPSPLSDREIEVMALVTEGRSNKEISDLLTISHRTVESHVRSILAKFGVRSRVELITLLYSSTKPGTARDFRSPLDS